MKRWRLLNPGPLPAWQQMAMDSVVIRARAQNQIPDTFRFMEFQPHTALVGYHQAVDLEVNRTACMELGVELNRRITGGGAIYMDSRQLGWELCLGKDSLPHNDAHAVYETLARVVTTALQDFGIHSGFRPVNDVEVGGRKISGTGGVEWGDAFIYQGTLLVDFDVDAMIRVLRLPVAKLRDKEVTSFRHRTVTMAELLGQTPSMERVKDTMIKAVESVLGVTLEDDGMTPWEIKEMERIAPSFREESWINRRVSAVADGEGYLVQSADYKAPGGLLRASVAIDAPAGRIRRCFLTGDFFAQPEHGPLDLEAALKDCPLNSQAVLDRVNEHMSKGYKYFGVDVADWHRVIADAAGLTTKGVLYGNH